MRKIQRRAAFIGSLLSNVLVGIGAVLDGGTAWARAGKAKSAPVLKVGVYNYAGVGALRLQEAEGEAGRLFARAGVGIAWAKCALVHQAVEHYPQCSSPDVVLRILPDSMAARLGPHTEALGESFAPTGPGHGWDANVFYSRVLDMSSPSGLDFALVLGEVAAHELGHLLLGPGHTRGGIMQAKWSPEVLKQASRGELQFDTSEAASLKEAVKMIHAKTAPSSRLAISSCATALRGERDLAAARL
jgi:hypothetical protein